MKPAHSMREGDRREPDLSGLPPVGLDHARCGEPRGLSEGMRGRHGDSRCPGQAASVRLGVAGDHRAHLLWATDRLLLADGTSDTPELPESANCA